MNSAVTIQMDFLTMDGIDVDACLWVGNTGYSGLYSVAEVLVGKINPSGRLSDTYLYNNFSSPAMASWSYNSNKSFSQTYSNYKDYSLGSSSRYYGVYVEGIYVGYRYYETRYEDMVLGNTTSYDYSDDVAYPFGYGLSYSEFEYSDYNVEYDEQEAVYHISVKVTNTGEMDGKEVVQIYLQKPYTDYDRENGVEKASVELVGYAKTGVLDADGGSQTVTIDVSEEQFKSYDSNKAETYILDAGDYYLTVAKNSHDAVNNILAAKGYSANGIMDSDGDESLTYKTTVDTLDVTTYSVSTQTGASITNRFDFMDINKYDGAGSNSVTYVSRSDWQGTFPTGSVELSVTDQMATDLQSHKEIVEDGSEMPDYGVDNGIKLISLRGLEYDNSLWDSLLDEMTYEEQSLLITYGAYSTVDIDGIIGKPATVDRDGPTSIDGSNTGMCLPSEGIWASTFNDELIERIGQIIGEDCINAGVQGVYAPGLNIHRTPFGGRAHEYFSEDSYLTGMACSAEVKGIQSRGVVAYVKHLAFNDEEANRNGICIWMNEQAAREIYLSPFEQTVSSSKGNAHGVMTSFNRAGCIWTSASSDLMLSVLRDEWYFDGITVTDMVGSNGASYMVYDDGILNGTNLFLASGTETELNDYRNSAIFANAMRESCHRILYVVCNYSAAMNGISANTKIISVTPWWQTTINVCIIGFAILMVASGGIWVYCKYFKNKNKLIK